MHRAVYERQIEILEIVNIVEAVLLSARVQRGSDRRCFNNASNHRIVSFRLAATDGPDGDFSRSEVVSLKQSLHQAVIQIACFRDPDVLSLEILKPLDIFMGQ